MKRWETNINICCNSRGSWSVCRGTSKKQLIRVMNSSYEVFAFAIQCAGDFMNDRPRGFLDKDYVKVWLLWDALDMNNFYFLFPLFSDFIGILFSFYFSFLLDDKEARDIEVIWQVTWCDIMGLEHDGRIWKMMSGHLKYTWWP